MLRSRILSAFCAGALSAALVAPVRAAADDRHGSLTTVPLPGGLRAALAAVDDPVPADRSQFLLEYVRRVHQGPPGADYGDDGARLQTLLAHLEASAGKSADTLPLPLTPAIWIDAVFGGGVTEENLVAAILRSREASLLYCGLLSLDEPTRAWFATRPDLIADIARRNAAELVVAAPGLHVAEGRVLAPGGAPADVIWQALVGHSVGEPAKFVRALLGQRDGRLAYFYASLARLTPEQLPLVLDVKSAARVRRARAGRRVYAIFDQVTVNWRAADRPFWRPAADPALLVSELQTDAAGRPVVPGTRRFWNAVFAERFTAADGAHLTRGAPVDMAWLLEQVFGGRPDDRWRRYRAVLFASRMVTKVTPDNAVEAAEAIRAAGTYPALVAVLERAEVTRVSVFAAAARRAAELSAIGDANRAERALAQFQGTLAVALRAASHRALAPEAVARLVSSLAAVNLGNNGEYDGAMVRWLDAHLRGPSAGEPPARAADTPGCGPVYADAPGRMDCELLHLIAGPVEAEPRLIDWEGSRYRVDFAGAEAARLAGHLGQDARPFLSSARALVETADTLDGARVDDEGLRRQAGTLERVLRAFGVAPDGGKGGPSLPGDDRGIVPELYRLALDGDVRRAAPLAAQVRLIADVLFARGLLEFVYAAALGHSDRVVVTAGQAAERHDFGLRSTRPGRAWQLPSPVADKGSGWQLTGSLLGLDVKLAEFSLLRVSSRPVARKPTLNGEDRRLLTEAVALIEPASLTETDRETIVTAIRKGRARLAATQSAAAAAALADEIRLSAARRALLIWVVVHDTARVSAFLSPAELLWLGLEGKPVEGGLHRWGAPAEPRLGCLCLRLLDRRPWEALAGRWHAGLMASGFPDLNLRLAELLAELEMPASMLAPVLAPATRDFIDAAYRRDPDDRRALVEFLHELSADRVEQYLSLLTADGPLVRVGQTTDTATGTPKSEVPR